jgi:hypothetical protein
VFIQPVHSFIRDLAPPHRQPPEHVIVFDEAQRAWDEQRMRTKQSLSNSEAGVALDIMSRAHHWAVIVALVGEGQEINTGEAGIGAWIDALQQRPSWRIAASPHITQVAAPPPDRSELFDELHLAVGVRAPRAQRISDWAAALLNGDLEHAASLLTHTEAFPLLITRSLDDMRSYLHDRAGPDRRPGLLASAQARRLRPFGIEMNGAFQGDVDWPRWFVDDSDDIRSSYALEVAASEFKCQGLELDWTGICWGNDLLWNDNNWAARKLSGSKWTNQADPSFALNRYRVLLTRARYGQVIWVPKPTQPLPLVDADGLDRTAEALTQAGAQPL